MSERAQALEAIRARLRNLETTKRAADRAGWTPTALVYYVEDVTTLLGLVVAPSVGVSPQLEADFQATADHIVSGIETKAESQIAWEICEALKEAASLSPVEPTPLSERHLPPAVVMLVSAASAASGYLERLQPDLAVRLWAGVQAVISTPDKTVEPKPLTGAELLDRFRQVEPAPPTPAPCVWTVDGWGHWHTTCGRMWTFADEGYTESRVVFCPGCGAPAVFPDQITR